MKPVQFTAIIHRFEEKGDKTGWTYIEIPADIAQELKPGNKKSFRVKGKLDKFPIQSVAILPMGGGRFVLPLNLAMRKGTGKKKGAMLTVSLLEDKSEFKFNPDFLDCLADEPPAAEFFQTLAPSHQRYFSKWIDDAKTEETRTKRIAICVNALLRQLSYGEMIRDQQQKKKDLL